MTTKFSATVPKWQYHETNIQGAIAQTNFNRADRTILFAQIPTKNTAAAPFTAVGLVQGFSNQEQKQLQVIYELGSANPMIIPGLTQGQISLSRVLLNGFDFLNTVLRNVYEADAKKLTNDNVLRSIRDINTPFNLMLAKYNVLEEEKKETSSSAINTVIFGGCQIQSRSESISAGGVVTLENVNIFYQNIPKLTLNIS